MTTATLTPADQLSFPKAICDQLQLKDGQRHSTTQQTR